MDTVAFSKLHDDDQVQAMECLVRWVNEALLYHSITEPEYRWSPAGDGGYLTFATVAACRKAIDVAFSICEKVARPDWVPRSGEKILLRFGLHAGTVREGREVGHTTNIWGLGINTAARLLTVSASSQVLVSKEYYDTYIKGQRTEEFEIGDVHWRTVKHAVQLEVMNVSRHQLGLPESVAVSQRWQSISGLWGRTVMEYTFLINDAMKSGQPIAALAAGKFLLNLNARDQVWDLCRMIGKTEERPTVVYPPRSHKLFSLMPPDVLMRVLEETVPKRLAEGDVICEQGDPARSCFFLVSGTIVVDVPGRAEPIRISPGEIIGEFSLWIPNLPRTARVRATTDGLLLEIDTARLTSALSDVPHVADVVYGIVKQRILENVLKSDHLFPTVDLDAARILAACERHEAGSRFDLTSSTYVLFSGRVAVEPPGAPVFEITAMGDSGRLEAFGIVSDIGLPDGPSAVVLEDAVVVTVAHTTLRSLQAKSERVRKAWNGMCGQRQGDISRRSQG
jgi:CRP-like cAMP-binding protein